MSLGGRNIGDKKVKETGLAKGVEYKSDPYALLDKIFFNETNEIVVRLSSKYMYFAVKALLDDMMFTYMGGKKTSTLVNIDLKTKQYKFLNHMDEMITYEVPSNWDKFETKIKDCLIENPTFRNHEVNKNKKQAIVGINSWIETFIDKKAMDSVEKVEELFREQFQNYVDREYITEYTSNVNPEIHLMSGKYSGIVDLYEKNKWAVQFEKDKGESVEDYIRFSKSSDYEINNKAQELLKFAGFFYGIKEFITFEGINIIVKAESVPTLEDTDLDYIKQYWQKETFI